MLLTEVVQDQRGHAISRAKRRKIFLALGERAELVGEHLCSTVFAGVHAMRPQATQRAQLVVRIAQAERRTQNGVSAAASRMPSAASPDGEKDQSRAAR